MIKTYHVTVWLHGGFFSITHDTENSMNYLYF